MFQSLNQREFISNMSWYYKHPGQLMGVPTGFVGLDVKLRGLRKKKLYTVAARPSMGKSALSAHMAYNQALAGFTAFFWCLEDEALDLHNRLASMRSGIPTSGIETGHYFRDNQRITLKQEDYTAYKEAGQAIAELPLLFRAYPTSVEDVSRELQASAAAGPRPDIVYVDYLQVVPGTAGKAYDNLNANIIALQALAVEWDIPVVVVSQLSRGVEGRENKRPLLSDMEGSGHIEQVSQAVLLLYSDDYYTRHANPVGFVPTCKLEVMVAKNKGGRTGLAELYYDQETQSIEDWRDDVAEPAPDGAPADVDLATGEVLF